MPVDGYNRRGAKVSQGVCNSFWLQGIMAGFPADYFCIEAFSETKQTEDLKRIERANVDPSRRRRSDCADSQLRRALSEADHKATLKVYPGAPHGMCTTHKDQVNEDFLAYIKT
jgi:non-heme chloroperoxidase